IRGYLEGPGRDHYIFRLEASGCALDHETSRSWLLSKRCRGHVAAQRCSDGTGVFFDISHHVIARRKGILIGFGIGKTGQPHAPLRSLKTKRVPPLTPPTFCDALALEYNMLSTELAEVIAHRETSLASSDDHRFNRFCRHEERSAEVGRSRCRADNRA